MGEATQVPRQARAAAQLEAPYLRIREQAVLGQLATQQRDLRQAAGVPVPGAHHRPCPFTLTGQERDEHLAQREQGSLREHPEEVDAGVVLEHGTQLVAALQRLHGDGVAAARRAGPDDRERRHSARNDFAVAHARLGGDDDTRSGHLAPPREIEVLAHRHDARVEPLELAEEVGADEDAPPRGDEHVAHRVVLAVVDLALEDPVDDRPRLVAAHPDVEEDGRVVPVDELGRDDAGVRTERLLDHLVHGVVVQRDVVVEEQVEGGTLDHAQHLVRGGAVGGTARQVADERVG